MNGQLYSFSFVIPRVLRSKTIGESIYRAHVAMDRPIIALAIRAMTVMVVLLILTACSKPTTYRPEISQAEINAEETQQQLMVEEAAKMGGMPRPWRNRPGMNKSFQQVASRIETAGAKLCQELGLPAQKRRCYYFFSTSSSKEINAHADGDDIVINQGMLRFVKDDDELALVMAHELAHNLMGHVDSMRNNALAGGALGMLLDAAAATQGWSTGGGFTDLGVNSGKITYSVAFEEEADYVGLYIAARAGFDVSRAAGLWRRWSVEDPKGMYGSSTHPSHASRFVAMQKTAAEIAAKRKMRVPLLPERNT